MKFSINILITIALLTLFSCRNNQQTPYIQEVSDKVRGLIYGTMIGDALGGPIEFQSHEEIQKLENPPKLWCKGEKLDSIQIIEATKRIILRNYRPLRPVPEPYGHWTLEPGSVTDDTRHKMVLLYALSQADSSNLFPIDYKFLANSYLKWIEIPFIKQKYYDIAKENLEETFKAVRWIQGNRNIGEAYPPERLWVSLPTCYGSMSLLPLAVVYPNNPQAAYLAAYNIAFFDNSFARDLNASLVVGLSTALSININETSAEQAWLKIFESMRTTDPYGYAQVPWTQRSVDMYLDLALKLADEAQGEPYKLFQALEAEFKNTIKWEAQVPFVVVFSCLKLCNYDPLAALALTIEWGHDHDSYAQLAGAFVGALHGLEIFDSKIAATVRLRMIQDYNEDAEVWAKFLTSLSISANKKTLIQPALN